MNKGQVAVVVEEIIVIAKSSATLRAGNYIITLSVLRLLFSGRGGGQISLHVADQGQQVLINFNL